MLCRAACNGLFEDAAPGIVTDVDMVSLNIDEGVVMGSGEPLFEVGRAMERRHRAVPRLPANLVPREGLIRRLDAMAALAVLPTLGGQGATTLLAEWARRRVAGGDQVVWIDPTVDDRTGVWAELDAARRRHAGRTIVVIDNNELAKDVAFVEDLCGFLRTERMVHGVVCGGSLHALLQIARRDRIECTVISGRDLIIATEEVAAYAEAWGHQPDRDWLARLHPLVGGFLVPLRIALAESSLRQDEVGRQAVAKYLQTDVLSQLDGLPLLRIASMIALGDVVTPTTVAAVLEDAVLGASGLTADDVILELWTLGLLTRVTGSEHVWQFPGLIRKTWVRALAHTDPDVVVRGHRVIGRGLVADRSNTGNLLRHARLGQDWELLALTWAEYSLSLLVDHPVEAKSAFEELPAEALAEKPALATPEALVALLSASTATQMAVALANRRRTRPSRDSTDAEILDDAATAMILRRREGDVVTALDLARKVGANIRNRYDGPRGAADWFQLQWSITEILAGDLSSAISRLTRVHEGGRSETSFMTAGAAAHLAMIHALLGENSAAVSWLQAHEGLRIEADWLAPLTLTPALVARAVMAIDRLDESTARESIARITDRTHDEMWAPIAYASTQYALHFSSAMDVRSQLEHLEKLHAKHLRTDGLSRRMLELAKCDVLLALGEVHRAEVLINSESGQGWWSRQARLRLITGDHVGALELASTSEAHPGSSVRDRVDLLMIRSAALHVLGRPEEHREAAARAHTLADYAGVDSACLRLPAGMCGHQHDHPSGSQRPFPERAELIVLSPRERHVLALMREHDSLADIAKELTVSINTVKKQSVAIHAKLGVRDRPAALMRAEALGLLKPRSEDRRR